MVISILFIIQMILKNEDPHTHTHTHTHTHFPTNKNIIHLETGLEFALLPKSILNVLLF